VIGEHLRLQHIMAERDMGERQSCGPQVCERALALGRRRTAMAFAAALQTLISVPRVTFRGRKRRSKMRTSNFGHSGRAIIEALIAGETNRDAPSN
jgi:hypothetical protein